MIIKSCYYRLKSVTPQHFISSQKKLLMRTLKLNLGKDVNLISIQDAPQGNLDILLYVRGVSFLLTIVNIEIIMVSSTLKCYRGQT